ncbi:MAG: hypothetical protein JJT85_10770 [Chromatiales bacterium]|nr:hypothetical protein [Chromatiales bacterium]
MKQVARIIELVGAPGAGKSTALRGISKQRGLASADRVLRRAAGSWACDEFLGGVRWPGLLLGSGLVLRYYMSRRRSLIRQGQASSGPATEMVTSWIARAAASGGMSAVRMLEHTNALIDVMGTDVLLRTFTRRTGDPVVVDEHWVQLLGFSLNLGEREQWATWARNVCDKVALPQRVVWLCNAHGESEQRQRQRQRVAMMLADVGDIATQVQLLEDRFSDLVVCLRDKGVDVRTVDASKAREDLAGEVMEACLARP